MFLHRLAETSRGHFGDPSDLHLRCHKADEYIIEELSHVKNPSSTPCHLHNTLAATANPRRHVSPSKISSPSSSKSVPKKKSSAEPKAVKDSDAQKPASYASSIPLSQLWHVRQLLRI